MPVQWSQILQPDFVHYYDPVLAAAWLDAVINATNEAAERAGDAEGPPGQVARVRNAWAWLGNAFRALDLRAPTVPRYADALRGAYGPYWAPDAREVPFAGNPGSIAQAADRLYRGAHRGARPGADWPTPIRIQLGADDGAVPSCVATDPDSCDRSYPNRAAFDGTPCLVGAGDWRCGGWDDPLVGTPSALAPLVLSARLANQIATDLRGADLAAVVTDAARAHAANLSGGASAPTHDVPEPYGWTRPAAFNPFLVPQPVVAPRIPAPPAPGLPFNPFLPVPPGTPPGPQAQPLVPPPGPGPGPPPLVTPPTFTPTPQPQPGTPHTLADCQALWMHALQDAGVDLNIDAAPGVGVGVASPQWTAAQASFAASYPDCAALLAAAQPPLPPSPGPLPFPGPGPSPLPPLTQPPTTAAPSGISPVLVVGGLLLVGGVAWYALRPK